ncbi:MAG: hypothetical protein EOP56_15665 [Sphingobacteriales bacterium]|nr:MAG: hypothetical protein EOP56_15665 [Sphingobacteriales bacterium]
MNAIPAFITSLTIASDDKKVSLDVQCLNDVFFGLRIEQHQLRQYTGTAIPVFLAPHAYEPLPMPDEEGTEVVIHFD